MKLPDFNQDPAMQELHRKMGIKALPQKSFLDHHQTYAPLRAAVITLPNGERASVHIEDGPMFHAVWLDLGGGLQAWATPDHETADDNATPISIETEHGYTMDSLFKEAVLMWTGDAATDCATWAEFVGGHIRAIWPLVERMQGTLEHGYPPTDHRQRKGPTAAPFVVLPYPPASSGPSPRT